MSKSVLENAGNVAAAAHDSVTFVHTLKVYEDILSKLDLAVDAASEAKTYMSNVPTAGGNLAGKKGTVMQDVADVYNSVSTLYNKINSQKGKIEAAKEAREKITWMTKLGSFGKYGSGIGIIKNYLGNSDKILDAYNDAYDHYTSGETVEGVKDTIVGLGYSYDMVTGTKTFDSIVKLDERQTTLTETYTQRYHDGEITATEMLFGFIGATGGNALGFIDAGLNFVSDKFPVTQGMKAFGIKLDIPDSWIDTATAEMGEFGEKVGGTFDYLYSGAKNTLKSWFD